MAERRPIVLVDGDLQELPTGDTLPGASGGSGSGKLTSIFIEDQFSDTGGYGSSSSTSAATKGNLVRVKYDVDVTSVEFEANEATSETYEAVITEVSDPFVGAILGRKTVVSNGGSNEKITFVFDTPIRMVPGIDYTILITQRNVTGTTKLLSSLGSDPLLGIVMSYDMGCYVTSNDIQGNEYISTFGNSYLGMVVNYDVIFNANGIGSGILSGTVDPTTEGQDGDFYYRTDTNTIFGPKDSGTWPTGVSLIGPEGNVDAYYAAAATTNLGSSPNSSSSAYATKGNRLVISTPGRIKSVTFDIESGGIGEPYEIVLAKMSDLSTGATLSNVYKQAITPASVNETHILTTPFQVTTGDIIFFGLTKTNIANEANPLIRYWTNNVDDYLAPLMSYSGSRGVRFRDNDIQNGDSPTDLTTSWWSMNIGFQPINALIPAGGTTGQVLSKINETDFNTEWVDHRTISVQSELTAAHTIVNADLDGDVIRRVNVAAATDITINSGLTSKEPVTFIATGAGAVSFAAGSGVTIHSAGGNLTIDGQYGSATLIPDADTADTYYLIGDLTT